MKTITIYIARLYLVNILTLLVVLSLLIVSADMVMNLGRFADQAADRLRAEGQEVTTLRHGLLTFLGVIDIWSPRLLLLFVYLNGLVLVAGMGFTCAQLVQHREFVALLASGISLHRAARPFLVVAVLMIAGQVAVQEFAVPRVAHLLPRDQDDSGERALDGFPVNLAADGDGRIWYASAFQDRENALEQLTVWERTESGALTRLITADRATWTDGGWTLEGGLARDPSAAAPTLAIDFLATDLDPTQLKVRYFQGFAGNLSTMQLGAMIEGGALDERSIRRLDRLRWGRLGGVLCAFFTLYAVLPTFMLRMPQPMLKAGLRAAPVGLTGFAASAASTSLAIPGLPVWLSALVPAAVMLSLALALYSSMRT